MTEKEALQVAIATLRTEVCLSEPQARDWRTYGDALQFNRIESRFAAERCDRLTEAAAVLQVMLERLVAS